ncbi:hypothetical protein A2U01_0027982, partial [Trifolium medium]|nr:hypothetical protein [Trifolium medium]
IHFDALPAGLVVDNFAHEDIDFQALPDVGNHAQDEIDFEPMATDLVVDNLSHEEIDLEGVQQIDPVLGAQGFGVEFDNIAQKTYHFEVGSDKYVKMSGLLISNAGYDENLLAQHFPHIPSYQVYAEYIRRQYIMEHPSSFEAKLESFIFPVEAQQTHGAGGSNTNIDCENLSYWC